MRIWWRWPPRICKDSVEIWQPIVDLFKSVLQASFIQAGCKGGANRSLAYSNRVTLTKGIWVVNGVLYFKLSNAIEHVLAIKETSAKLQECNYLRLSVPKLQECTRIRSLCCQNQMDLCRNCSWQNYTWREVSGGKMCHRVTVMPEITQGIEASGVVFGGQQGSLVQSVSALMPKTIQAIEASGRSVLWSTRQQSSQ